MKIRFIRNTPCIGYAYMEGQELICEKPFAKEMIELGVAIELESKDGSDLPVDIPMREQLIASGIETIEQLKSIATSNGLTALKGIGKKSAENIINYLA